MTLSPEDNAFLAALLAERDNPATAPERRKVLINLLGEKGDDKKEKLDFLASVQKKRAEAGLQPISGMTPEKEEMYWACRIEDEPYERALMGLPQKLYEEPYSTQEELSQMARQVAKINQARE